MLAAVPAPVLNVDRAQTDIQVVFTSVEATLAALKEAGSVAKRLRARITLVVPQVIPDSGRGSSPSGHLSRADWRFCVIADQMPVETRILLFPCRDRIEKLTSVLDPKSLVIIGGARGWLWNTPEEKLAVALRNAGYEVIFAGRPS